MTLESGRRLGPYEIVAPLGAGGMGEVYTARDTRLERTVAVKVLPAALSENPQLRLRFEREAKVISSLNHPHICSLFDVGSDSGVDYLVLEHLEGETLDERIARGALPLDDVFRFAIQIADALDKAHRRGITHRDLKPSNVMITKMGAKLLDFGLARPTDGELDAAVSVLTGATVQKPITTEGTIVGTFQYMAPEQIEGKPADARADVFAFGALLYEMLTGKRAFDGKSRASIVAAVLATDPPPVSAVRPVAPDSLDRIVRLCLVKDPDERWQSAHDLKLELERAREARTQTDSVRAERRTAKLPWVVAGALLVGMLAVLALRYPARDAAAPSIEFQILPPQATLFGVEDSPAAISPDGTKIAVRLGRAGSEQPIWVRSLDSLEFKPLVGTESGFDAVWSPDSSQIAFTRERKLQRIPASGGPVTSICDVTDSRGAAWLDDGTIVIASGAMGPIMAVSAGGGPLRPVTRLDVSRKETGHWRPTALPGGRFLYVAQSTQRDLAGVYAASLESPEATRVLDVATTTYYVEPGWLLYHHEGGLFAQGFDARKLEKRGSPVRLVDSVAYFTRWGQPGYHATPELLAYHPGETSSEGELMRVAPAGGEAASIGASGANLDLSDDGTRVAFMKVDRATQTPDIWVHDLRRGVSSRVTFGKEINAGPVWSPDNERIAYIAVGEGTGSIRVRLATGAGAEETVFTTSEPLEVVDWSPDGRTLLIERFREATRSDLVFLDLQNPKAVRPLVVTPFAELSARFSPDGKWFAYVSEESGQREIYVQPFPTDGRKVQISTSGGDAPRWKPDGKELFFVTRDDALMGVELAGGDPLSPGTPREVVRGVSSDLVLEPSGSVLTAREATAAPVPIVAVTNWTERLK